MPKTNSLLSDYQKNIEQLIFSILPQLISYQNTLHPSCIWKKDDGSFVTAADYGVQFLIQKALAEITPSIALICEESTDALNHERIQNVYDFVTQYNTDVSQTSIPRVLSKKSSVADNTFWLIDPIDGTSGFIKNKSFAVAISLIIEGIPHISVMACSDANIRKNHPEQPFLVFSAQKHCGAFSLSMTERGIEYQKISTAKNPTHRFCEATMSTYNQQHLLTKKLSERLSTHPKPLRLDSQYKYVHVATGWVDFFLRAPHIAIPAKPWDHFPGVLITEEAGGIVSDLFGKPLTLKTPLSLDNHAAIIASSNKALHNEILTVMQSIYHL